MGNSAESNIPLKTKTSDGTIPSIWRLVSKQDQIIVPLNSQREGLRVYCVHSIGGDLAGYDKLAEALGNERPIFGLQVPKSMMVASAANNIEDMARRYASAIMRFQPEGPLVIAGYSAGAVVGLEIAQQLRLQGRDIPLLVAFDGAPSNTGAGVKPGEVAYFWRLLCNVPWRLAGIRARDFRLGSLRMRLAFRRSVANNNKSKPHRAAELEAASRVFERGGWPKEQQLFIRESYNAMVSYIPRPYAGAVLLYEVKAQPFLQLAQFGAAWRRVAVNCEVVSVNTRHSEFFNLPAGLRRVVSHLQRTLRTLDDNAASLMPFGETEPLRRHEDDHAVNRPARACMVK